MTFFLTAKVTKDFSLISSSKASKTSDEVKLLHFVHF